jgi:hypothetical protein
VAPITDCMKAGRFSWSKEAIDTFEVIKAKLTTTRLLVLPDFTQPFELHCDTWKVGIGVVLSQGGKPVAYFSEKLCGSKLNYNTYEVEFYAVVQSLKHWSSYLAYSKFILYSDHEALKHLNSQNKLSSRHAQWATYVQQFSFTIKDKSRALNKVVDALSQKTLLITSMKTKVVGFEFVKDALCADPFFGPLLNKVIENQNDYCLHDGFLSKGTQLCS